MRPWFTRLPLGLALLALVSACTPQPPAGTDDPSGNTDDAADAGPSDTDPPTTTASPPGGTYNMGQMVTLTCSDGTRSGCAATRWTNDGFNPGQWLRSLRWLSWTRDRRVQASTFSVL